MNTIPWRSITPDKNHDWINQRDENYYNNPTLDNDIFYEMSIGVTTNRDNWIYGFNKDKVDYNTELMISNYNNEIERLKDIQTDEEKLELVTNDRDKIKWSATLKRKFLKNEKIDLNKNIIQSMYRPFTKKWLYYDKDVIERPRQFSRYWGDSNIAIAVSGKGSRKGFSVLAVDSIPSMDMLEKCRVYNKDNFYEEGLFDSKTSNVNSNFIIKNNFENENEAFAYLYGLLNSKDYQTKYENDLLKDVPRIPKLANANEFIRIGKKLLDLHLKYEEVEPYKDITIEKRVEKPCYKVDKLRFGKGKDKTIIKFNKDITIKNVPEEAYEYVVNGRSAIEWIVDQYRVVTDEASGIIDDPNEYSEDPKYIFKLLLSIINVSVQTVELVNSLPPLEIIEE